MFHLQKMAHLTTSITGHPVMLVAIAYVGLTLGTTSKLFEREHFMTARSSTCRQLVLVMFDVKLKNVKKNSLSTAGEKFANKILIPLYKDNPTKMKVIISVPDFTLKDFIVAVLSQLKATGNPDIIQKIGFDISWESKLTESGEKEKALRDLGVSPYHAWLSSGITNWSPKKYLDELSSQVKYRDNGNYFSKVYAWSVDKKSTAKTYLEMGLDGLIMNFPGRMNEAIAEINKKKGQTMRLATLDDDPFELIK
ncbi:sphingomyelinase D [Paramuricea clavata]|uniref:Sphingomyelinase D, partial n=1 Tax=Paramuricea clavata TaxID=317549 RepID=A0A7D9I8Z8_PARCT|nr:sphingomyelinase D [Paramuricea clavata]